MTRRDDNRENDETRRARVKKIVCYVLCSVFAAAAIACVAAYVFTRLDALFIPIALTVIAAMISFTYARIGRY